MNLGATSLEKGVYTDSEYPKENPGNLPVISWICLFNFFSFIILKVNKAQSQQNKQLINHPPLQLCLAM